MPSIEGGRYSTPHAKATHLMPVTCMLRVSPYLFTFDSSVRPSSYLRSKSSSPPFLSLGVLPPKSLWDIGQSTLVKTPALSFVVIVAKPHVVSVRMEDGISPLARRGGCLPCAVELGFPSMLTLHSTACSDSLC